MPRRRKPPRPGAISELPPLRIASQIVLLQAIYYAVALFLMLFMSLVAGTGFSLDLVFGWSALRGDTTQGWLVGFVWLCCAAAVVVALVVFVARSKLIPDFALTLHFIHLIVVYFYTGLVPRFAMWWVTMLASSAATVSLGMWGCRWRELKPISFGGAARTAAAAAAAAAGGNDAGASAEAGGQEAGDEEMGFSRGRGRGRGRDGGGEYEMVGLQPDNSR
ncbi:integral membrane protein S linking to the trans Golgi network-domain-containing protein [Xylariales sp. PMI_506]|nr:integral membrane protein S linking to the trans Golgi network-domain-containing protein [Xylariales sp. PMI_506]